MKQGFRHAMSWLHTWGSLWFSWVLFAIFLTGTLGVFDDAISHWMREPGRAPLVQSPDAAARQQAAAVAQARLQALAPGAEFWGVGLPNAEEPALRLSWRQDPKSTFQRRLVDPRSGEELPPGQRRESEGGHHFVHLHFEFHAGAPGMWLAGIATVAMLVALVSGIAVHKKIFADFFTFRPGRGQRSWLDAHNALGVLTLPFLFMIAYTGLTVFWSFYMPAAVLARFDDEAAYFSRLTERPAPRPLQQRPAPLGPLTQRVGEAEAALARDASFISVRHPGDASAVVQVFGRFDGEAAAGRLVGRSSGRMEFDGVSGEQRDLQLPDTTRGSLVLAVQQTMNALHFVRFGGDAVKWLYFLCGLAGSAMIAAGLCLFVVKRRRRQSEGRPGPVSPALIDALNAAAVAGLMLACLAYFWGNRLLPLALEQRSAWEIRIFFLVWALALAHALVRRGAAWREQLWAVAVLGLGLPLLNAASTGDHLLAALARGDGQSAAVEAVVLLWAVAAAVAARRLGRPERAARPLPALAGEGG